MYAWSFAAPAQPPIAYRLELEPLPGSQSTAATEINDRGAVVGTATAPASASNTAVIWEHGTIMELTSPTGAVFASGVDINNHGTVLGNALLPTIVRRSSGRMERPVSCRCCRGQRGRIRMRSTTATPSLAVASPISLPATWWRRSGGAVAHRISTRKLQPTIPQRRSFICSGRCSSTIADRSSFRGRDSRATSPDEVGFYLLTPQR